MPVPDRQAGQVGGRRHRGGCRDGRRRGNRRGIAAGSGRTAGRDNCNGDEEPGDEGEKIRFLKHRLKNSRLDWKKILILFGIVHRHFSARPQEALPYRSADPVGRSSTRIRRVRLLCTRCSKRSMSRRCRAAIPSIGRWVTITARCPGRSTRATSASDSS